MTELHAASANSSSSTNGSTSSLNPSLRLRRDRLVRRLFELQVSHRLGTAEDAAAARAMAKLVATIQQRGDSGNDDSAIQEELLLKNFIGVQVSWLQFPGMRAIDDDSITFPPSPPPPASFPHHRPTPLSVATSPWPAGSTWSAQAMSPP